MRRSKLSLLCVSLFPAVVFFLTMGSTVQAQNGGEVVAMCAGIDDTASLSASITAANGGWVVIEAGSVCASSDLTIPNLKILKGGFLKSLGGHTVVLGSFDAGLYQTFTNATSGQGSVLFHQPPVTGGGETGLIQAYPQWWGCTADYAHDCAPALTAAINSGARRIFLPGGGYGLASPVVINGNNFVLEGASRVYTDILPLAADIHVGTGPNAMFINAQRSCTPATSAICLPTNCVIEKLRFTSSIAFTGWAMWAEDGVPGSEALFSSIIKDCWVSMGQTALGFFHGSLNDCFIENLDVENTGFVFHLQGDRIGGDTFSHIHVLNAVEPVIYSVANPSTLMRVNGLNVFTQQQESLFQVTDGTDWTIDGVSLDYDSGGSVHGGFGQFDRCTRLMLSNFTARRMSGNMAGISLKDTTGKIQNGYIYDPRQTAALSQAISIQGASDLDLINVHIEGGTVPHVGLAGSGNIRIAHCYFNKSPLMAVVSTAVGSMNLTIRDSEVLNSSYNGPPVLPLLDIATSGRFLCLNNTIGVDDPAAVPNSYFSLTGSGEILIDNNIFLGGLNVTSPGSTQSLRLGRNYGLATSFHAAAMPSNGSWKQGDIVYALLPIQAGASPNKYIIVGWVRLTTGSGNLLNTDWMEMRTLTGN